MKNYSIKAAILLLSSIAVTSCVDRKTQKEDDTIRLEAPKDNTADTDYTEASGMTPNDKGNSMSNEDMVEIAEAKGIINDYYDAFTRKAAREAFDMWDPENNTISFSQFSEENPNYEKIAATFTEDTQIKQVDSVYTATIPLSVSTTATDGNITNSKGVIRLKKDAKKDNAKYMIESIDLNKEDS